MDDFIKLPRLYVDDELQPDRDIALTVDHAHYLRAVLRRNEGDQIRIFNGRDGEFLCTLSFSGKKSATARPKQLLIAQPTAPTPLHLYFCPIKKARLDFLIEKAVELGATHLHPVLTQNTENRHSQEKRLRAQIIEAAEQCERLDLPLLSPPQKLAAILAAPATPLYACIERQGDAPHLAAILRPGPVSLLIGPEGGFTTAEIVQIQTAAIPVTLGPQILRSETACCAALVTVQNKRQA